MERENFWYGWLPHKSLMFPKHKVEAYSMTALALAYSPVLGKFAIAADGLSTAENYPAVIDTDHQQKIFPFQHNDVSIALAFAGLGRTRTNSFDTVLESTKQMNTLIK